MKMRAGNPGTLPITLDGKGGSDTYNIEQGLGSFGDIEVQDSDPSTQNTLNVDFHNNMLLADRAEITDNTVQLTYETPVLSFDNLYYYGPSYNSTGYHFFSSSVVYSPTVYFGANVNVALTAREFEPEVVAAFAARHTAAGRQSHPASGGVEAGGVVSKVAW